MIDNSAIAKKHRDVAAGIGSYKCEVKAKQGIVSRLTWFIRRLRPVRYIQSK